MNTESLLCPSCGLVLGPAMLPKPRKSTTGFDSCVRRCVPCGVGVSNGDAPTKIHRDPLDNLPPDVRAGALSAIRASLNERNRKSKEARFGFWSSEDAVSWTVFSWLARENPEALIRLGERLQLRPTGAPTVYLWGVALSAAEPSSLTARLNDVLAALGESSHSRTEPDVMLDFGPDGLVIVEVKHRAGNDVQPASDAGKFDRYVRGTDAFGDPDLAVRSAHYELTRNWRVGHDLASSAPFRLVNLGRATLFERRADEKLEGFENSLARTNDREFIRLEWADFLSDLQADTGPLPTWLAKWLADRRIPV